jgi:hypothetical protein
VLLALPALAGAANPANSFVIGWQQYTKTGSAAADRFITWQITSTGALSRRFLQITYAGPQPGYWLTTEGYVYRDPTAAKRGLAHIVDVATTRGPIETARSAQFFTLPLPADVQGKGILVTTQSAVGQQVFSFWCWRQVNVVFCNRAPSATAYLLGQVAAQQVPAITRVVLG